MNQTESNLKFMKKYYYRIILAGCILLSISMVLDFLFIGNSRHIKVINFIMIAYLFIHYNFRHRVYIKHQMLVTFILVTVYGSYLFLNTGSNGNGAYMMLIGISVTAIFVSFKASYRLLIYSILIFIVRTLIKSYSSHEILEIIGMIAGSVVIILSSNIMKSRLKRTIFQLNREKNNVVKMAFYNQLTGLPNRNYYMDRINSEINTEITGTVVVFNLVDFHKINEIYGYESGDKLLKALASFLKSKSDVISSIGYLGNNTFTFWIRRVVDRASIKTHLQTWKELFNTNFNILQPIEVSTVAISASFSGEKSIESTLALAEKALVRMKKGNNRFLYLDEEAYRELEYYDKLTGFVLESIKDDNYINVYQEKFNTKDNKVYGVEVLTRLYYNGEWVDPEKFINILEDKDKIIDFGNYIYSKVFRVMSSIVDHYGEDVVVSFNVSPKELVNPGYVDELKCLIKEHNVNFKNIELEITENILISNLDFLLPVFKELHELGIRISLDDFGSGYSSLKYIADLPIDTIKIDKSFISDVENSEVIQSVISSIIQISRAKKTSVVAEGIETLNQSKMLLKLGCYKFQGYYYSKPRTLDEILKCNK